MAYKNHQIVDLTQPIYSGMPVFVGHPDTWRWTNMTHEVSAASGRFKSEMSYYSGVVQMCEHGPTHVDSISHLDPSSGAPHIDKMPFDFFYGRGIAVDFENVADNSYINAGDVKRRLDKYKLQIRPGDTLLYTYGHYKRHYPRPSYTTAYAGWTRDAAEYVYGECGCLNVGTDAPSMDMAHSSEYPCHLVCRDLGRTNTENLCNIEDVVGKEFLYIGLPLKIQDGSGSPIRAIAVLNA
ncbi:MAG: cyclase family protein [Candidatus Tectomicrobia bacterium]|nr:cyclase family protein [Candidatus Tectomicrobia bacterium]